MRESWSEDDSGTFLREADCFVPDRELVIESICRLVPTSREGDRQDAMVDDAEAAVDRFGKVTSNLDMSQFSHLEDEEDEQE